MLLLLGGPQSGKLLLESCKLARNVVASHRGSDFDAAESLSAT
jgi:hypothetical protein